MHQVFQCRHLQLEQHVPRYLIFSTIGQFVAKEMWHAFSEIPNDAKENKFNVDKMAHVRSPG